MVIAADINDDNLAKISTLENVHAKKLDVSSDEIWAQVVQEVKEQFGRIDILINNAGVSSENPANLVTEQDWLLMQKINSFGPFLGIKHVGEVMKEQKSGSTFPPIQL